MRAQAIRARVMGMPDLLVVCVENEEYPASLELRKIYVALPDRVAGEHGMVRVIDESGEDYLFPEGYFVPIKLPLQTRRAVLRARRLR